MNMLAYQFYYLVGIKGVAMTALAQCLVDAGKTVRGSDVAEDFVTKHILAKLDLEIADGFATPLPTSDCVIYTAAHGAADNPQVLWAVQNNIPVFSHAEALAAFFNQKRGIAVCGVGGKSTTSAMIAWIFESVAQKNTFPHQSFAVGVGNIPGLEKTGQWLADNNSQYFVAEADEYVTNPRAAQTGEAIVPRFSFLFPHITVCTNLRFDHPDVYTDFAHTQAVYKTFFEQVRKGGALIVNGDDGPLVELAQQVASEKALKLMTFGSSSTNTLHLQKFTSEEGKTLTTFSFEKTVYELELQIPGEFNARNAIAAVAAAVQADVPIVDAVESLKEFRSTMRRSEFIGIKNGVSYYDDYAHHPNEVQQVIHAFKEWYPNRKVTVAFQSHTFSRTKALLSEFSKAFSEADAVIMTDIFPSAREAADSSISSDVLCDAIRAQSPNLSVQNLHTNQAVAQYCKKTLGDGEVFITIGAGDIYHVHEQI